MPDRLQRPQPQRTCVACRSTGGKQTLLRVVRGPDGSVSVDETGKRAGRGAYLCSRLACWQAALKKGRLDAALRVTMAPDDKLALTQFAVLNLRPEPELAAVSGGAPNDA